MAPIGFTKVPVQSRNSFYQDPCFSDCWGAVQKQKEQFEADCNSVHTKVFGNSHLRAISLLAPSTLAEYVKPLANATETQDQPKNGIGTNLYKILLDVHHFGSNNLTIRPSTNEKNVVIIEGKHPERREADNNAGFVSRQFIRRCVLPFNIDTTGIHCNVSSDGVLEVIAVKEGTRNGFRPRQRELMTVDGRKLAETDIDLGKLDSRFVRAGPYLNGLNHNGYNGMYWNPSIQILPDFDMIPFWDRNSKTDPTRTRQEFTYQDKSSVILVDVKQFAPEELTVRSSGSFVVVEGKHDHKEDPFGSISRQFTKRFDLPKGTNTEEIQSSLTSNGMLQITLPQLKPKSASELQQVRRIPIVMNNQQLSQGGRDGCGPKESKIVATTPQKAEQLEKMLNGHGHTTREKVIPISKPGFNDDERPIISAH